VFCVDKWSRKVLENEAIRLNKVRIPPQNRGMHSGEDDRDEDNVVAFEGIDRYGYGIESHQIAQTNWMMNLRIPLGLSCDIPFQHTLRMPRCF
jgi:hypothetical protein